MNDLDIQINLLSERWCETRNLEPLRLLLNAKVSLNGLTDGWEEFREDLRTIRVNHGSALSNEELDALVRAIHIADKALERDVT